MRSTDERVAAVKQRAAELERNNRSRRNHFIGFSAVAASLLFIVGLGFAMPGIIEGLPGDGYTYTGAAASILGSGGAFGYVLVGLLAFVLGVSVTILSNHIHLKNKAGREEVIDGDGRVN